MDITDVLDKIMRVHKHKTHSSLCASPDPSWYQHDPVLISGLEGSKPADVVLVTKTVFPWSTRFVLIH